MYLVCVTFWNRLVGALSVRVELMIEGPKYNDGDRKKRRATQGKMIRGLGTLIALMSSS